MIHTGLSDEEIIHQLVTLYGAGIEPVTNLIANTLWLMLTDSRFVAIRHSDIGRDQRDTHHRPADGELLHALPSAPHSRWGAVKDRVTRYTKAGVA